MIPILYPIKQTIFTNNGICPLSDAISCECTEQLENEYEIELVVPRDSRYVDEIKVDCAIKVKPNYEDPPQIFRIYSVEKNHNDDVTIKAAHISYDTSGIPILPFTSENLDDTVYNLNNNRMLLSGSKFVLHNTFQADGELKNDSPTSFRSLLGGQDNSVISVYGGEYHYDNFTIELVKKRGTDRGICFRYGKNITDFNQETNSENVYTAVLGFWKKSNGEGQEDTIVYGNIIQCDSNFPYDKIYILDTSSDIKNENDAIPTVDQIDEQVNKYIRENIVGLPKSKMKIDYVDNDDFIKICLGDTVGIIYPEYHINAVARCNKVVFDCLKEKNKSIEIGIEDKNISDSIAELSNK